MKRLWIALAALLACGSANAQSDYPNKPVRLIVDSAAGSANDATARILADKLSAIWGQQVIVMNQPGAGGGGRRGPAVRTHPGRPRGLGRHPGRLHGHHHFSLARLRRGQLHDGDVLEHHGRAGRQRADHERERHGTPGHRRADRLRVGHRDVRERDVTRVRDGPVEDGGVTDLHRAADALRGHEQIRVGDVDLDGGAGRGLVGAGPHHGRHRVHVRVGIGRGDCVRVRHRAGGSGRLP